MVNQQVESDAASDTKAEAELAQYVAENRKRLPPLPNPPSFDHLKLSPEALKAAAEREQREERQAAMRNIEEIHRRAAELVADAGQRYRNCTLENFECKNPQQRRVVAALTEYLNAGATQNVILYGPVGTGKDHLAFALCKAAIKAGRYARWVNGQAWFGAIRDAMDTERSESSMMNELSRPEVLCLSDPLPPVGPLNQFQTTMLYRLVDARYSKGLPTICTINVAADAEADERMGAATWDRLTHGAWKLHCEWETYRKPAMWV